MARLVDRSVSVLGDLKLPERYQIRRHIANGGMASVWCAHDGVLGRDVAIKLLAEPFAHDQAAIRRFKREARAAARLSSHPYVVTIYDVGEAVYDAGEAASGVAEAVHGASEGAAPPIDAGRRAFIVMEYLAGGTVADALRVGEVTRPEALRWLGEAASALDYAHGRGVIHRDIKPANFLLDRARVLHVADFGIARLGTEDAITSTGYMLGTATYLAPERALGHPATEASDRYSLAVAAFELLTGERPFRAEQFAAQAQLHIEQPAPRASSRNPALPTAVDAVLARGMAKRPEDRWATASAMVDTLDLALTEGAGKAARRAVAGARTAPMSASPPPLQLLRTSARPRPPRRGLALAALAAAAFGVGLAAGSSRDTTTPRARVTAGTSHPVTHAAGRVHRSAPRHPPAARPKPTVTVSQAAATSTPPTADTLEARGHQLMLGGDYAAAIPILRQAVAAARPSSLTYAYALFDLGHSLRVAGDPRAAIPVLYKRLQFPNQTGVVRSELQAALQAVGAQVRNAGGGPGAAAAPAGPGGPGGPPGHDKHKGHAD